MFNFFAEWPPETGSRFSLVRAGQKRPKCAAAVGRTGLALPWSSEGDRQSGAAVRCPRIAGVPAVSPGP